MTAVWEAMEADNYCTNAPEAVYHAGQTLGLRNVARYDYTTLSTPAVAALSQEWLLESFRGMIPMTAQSAGASPSHSEGASGMVQEMEQMFAAGLYVNAKFSVVIGRK